MPIWNYLPEDVLMKAKQLRVDFRLIEEKFVRGHGKGGQKINKTSNTVWLKDLKTGLEVKVQKHRELYNNRLSAYKLLVKKIENKILGEKSTEAKRNFKIRKQKKRRSKRAKEKILETKKARSGLKISRQKINF